LRGAPAGAPLLISLRKVIGWRETTAWHEAFRHSLSGEFSILTAAIGDMRISSDRGLEIEVLAQARRHLNPRAICQADIADR
jgi:glucosyl-3-phosphoglycerate synthase